MSQVVLRGRGGAVGAASSVSAGRTPATAAALRTPVATAQHLTVPASRWGGEWRAWRVLSRVEGRGGGNVHGSLLRPNQNRRWLHVSTTLAARGPGEEPPAAAGEKALEEVYQRKTPVEHVLLRPDSYELWVLSAQSGHPKAVLRECGYVPALYKIFDEILVNAADNKQRDPNMTTIKVWIDAEQGSIRILNDGQGIPVHVHKQEGLYLPELLFGHLLTGSNFDDSVAKVTGGRNGYGAKLANIFSKEFTVETVDCKRGFKFVQTWRDNMSTTDGPRVSPLTQQEQEAKDYTVVTFKPDLSRFGMQTLKDDDILSVMNMRVYDVAGCNETLKVYLNERPLPGSFKDYLSLYYGPEVVEEAFVFDKINDRWQVGVGISDSGQFSSISFVNSINTRRGGTHVNYIADQVVKYVVDKINKTDPDLKVQPAHVKNHLTVFVNALVENPSFDSQTKETLTTRPRNFGSDCQLSTQLLDNILERTRIVDTVSRWMYMKQSSDLARKAASGRSGTRIYGIPKLDDANLAGSANSKDCTLILTEGDSAKSLAVAGLSILGRDHYGVYPLKGKLLNVRDATHRQLLENKEINEITTILGLNHERTYSDAEATDAEQSGEVASDGLRYGKVMLMTDQDHDGSHIKGLFINFLHRFWPSLLEKGYVEEFITPIVKATKKGAGNKKEEKVFFAIPEYQRWKEELDPAEKSKWRIKYYKGLGTNTTEEGKEYFKALGKHRIGFEWQGEQDGRQIDMAFSKDQVEQRKQWLMAFYEEQKQRVADHNYDVPLYSEDLFKKDEEARMISYSDFINKELVLFSNADNIRSIPSVIDGLKPGQRKVLYACFKRKLHSEMKVAQLAGYVSEQTAYHHGEASLHSTIVHMAQNFPGSNNVPLLYPAGQFGTRLQGGKDAASARYIFTRLDPAARLLFREEDDHLLNYLDEDGEQVQPQYFVPVLPTILLNGCEGLAEIMCRRSRVYQGTGWSTQIPSYNPLQIIENLRRKIEGKEMEKIAPWYRGLQGPILRKKGSPSYVSIGLVEKINPTTIRISDLPAKRWTATYKEFLDQMAKPPRRGRRALIKGFKEHHTENSVDFHVYMTKEQMELAESVGLVEHFKLYSQISLNNMHLFDKDGKIRRFECPLEIIDEFFPLR
ncbi:DNA gyrase/topoisomerase IV, A subunit [Acanthamoeba castellanii str. Neff]|uniref:DNA topoisomerase 2 n=1 Tax=Acanthamoeba castellanii (strain ATCC 30010 / Neff) TaxID=1257118 RepID=L8H0X6_ACACF|nr:DNA gyrase/topoisomerase IV, A subunit [Acanthamoeba castellanii str. Neff]ELR18016.1 DNA gyrase/topoisomerase IV, A subunit [Acanthamoeba castellanii str. Neff]